MLFHEPTQSLLLQVPDPLAIRDLIPQSRVLMHTDYNIAIRHTSDATRVLRNLGMDAPGPIQTQYSWPGKYRPFNHQRVMAEFLTLHRRAFNLSEMGVGKSAAALWAADYLMTRKMVKKALILAPLSTLDRIWLPDIYDVLLHRSAVIVHGSRERRMRNLGFDVDFYILNHDGVKIDPVAKAIHTRPDIDLVIIDEASMFRNASSDKYKALRDMLRPDQRLWLLTGTPCPTEPTDVWSLAQLVDPARVPKFFGAFKRKTMIQVSQFKWVPRVDAYVTAYQAMQPAIRFRKADCQDLPPVTTQEWQAELTADQKTAYAAMVTALRAEVGNSKIQAVNAADKIGKLRQILCGAIRDPITGQYLEINHKPRTELTLDAIRAADTKAIVIVPFKGILQSLDRDISQHFSTGVLNGDVSINARNSIIAQFKSKADPHVLLCHPKVMAHGLNLTEANMLIFYAPIDSSDEFQQVTERINRTGQKHKMTIVRIGAHPLEWAVYKHVDTSANAQDSVLKLYSSIISGDL